MIVASRSMVTRPPPPPGAESPACAHASSRAWARAARIAFSARGPARCQVPDQSGDHRVGGDRPGQLRLVAQRRDIGEAVTAEGDRRSQVGDDLPWVMHCPRCTPPFQSFGQAPAQAGDPDRLPQQDGAGLGYQALAVG
jgi:hypothetical protein